VWKNFVLGNDTVFVSKSKGIVLIIIRIGNKIAAADRISSCASNVKLIDFRPGLNDWSSSIRYRHLNSCFIISNSSIL
jgi:hypothetical protein